MHRIEAIRALLSASCQLQSSRSDSRPAHPSTLPSLSSEATKLKASRHSAVAKLPARTSASHCQPARSSVRQQAKDFTVSYTAGRGSGGAQHPTVRHAVREQCSSSGCRCRRPPALLLLCSTSLPKGACDRGAQSMPLAGSAPTSYTMKSSRLCAPCHMKQPPSILRPPRCTAP